MSTLLTLNDVLAERDRQDEKWGEQNHPDGTAQPGDFAEAEAQREATNRAAAEGTLTWRDILAEEVKEAFAESDPELLRKELVETISVAFAWIEAIERRAT